MKMINANIIIYSYLAAIGSILLGLLSICGELIIFRCTMFPTVGAIVFAIGFVLLAYTVIFGIVTKKRDDDE